MEKKTIYHMKSCFYCEKKDECGVPEHLLGAYCEKFSPKRRNFILITSCQLCGHCSKTHNGNDVELFCNHLDLNKVLGVTDMAHLTNFPIPDECPILKEQR